jgi:pimeloyl-ACP methyl ester carboxylesterase
MQQIEQRMTGFSCLSTAPPMRRPRGRRTLRVIAGLSPAIHDDALRITLRRVSGSAAKAAAVIVNGEIMPGKTFVLVHGAWHGGWCWRRVADLLEKQGHKVFTPTLTGLGERSHLLRAGINVSTHVTDVVNVLKWEGLSDVVLCGHSYGGLVVSGVAEQAGGQIGSIVFLDAFVPDDGDSMAELTSGAVRDNLKIASERGDLGVPARSAAAFLVNEKDRAWVDAMCVPQPIGTMTEAMKLTGAREKIAKKSYIRAGAYPNPGFDKALARVKADKTWRTYDVPCGHDVMVDMPERLAEILVEVG